MNSSDNSFLSLWHTFTIDIAYGMFGIGVLITLVYFVRLSLLKDKPSKYNFINKNEWKYFWYSLLAIIIGLGFLINSLFEGVLYLGSYFEFVIEVVLASMISATVGYAFYVFFKFYYPSIIENKLKKIRFNPRISPSGNTMVLLNENEEDAYLTPEMIEQEESFAYEYDVWLDKESGHKIIEKYDAHLHALVCPNCNFRTLKEYKESILKEPSQQEEGALTKHYRCTYCKHTEIKKISIASLSDITEASSIN